MSEETKNENNEEVEETSEDVETEEESEETSEEVEADEESAEDPEDASEEDEADDSTEEDTSDEDGSPDDESDDGVADDASDDEAEEASDDQDGSDDEDTSDSDETSDEEDGSDSEEASDDQEASDNEQTSDNEQASDDEGDADEASDSDDDQVEDTADEAEEPAADAADHVAETDSPVRRSGSESVDEVDVEDGELEVEDGGEDPHIGLLTGDHVEGVAAYFDHPDHLLYAAAQTRDSEYEAFDAFSPFPIHGMDDALGLGRSWIPWVTFGAGCAGFMTAVGLQFGIMGFDWPMNFGGKPFIAWPSFVPIMFELTVLLAGVTTGLVMLKAAGCFKKPFIIDPEITNDRFVLWISASDENFDREGVIEFMKELNPSEIRTIKKDA